MPNTLIGALQATKNQNDHDKAVLSLDMPPDKSAAGEKRKKSDVNNTAEKRQRTIGRPQVKSWPWCSSNFAHDFFLVSIFFYHFLHSNDTVTLDAWANGILLPVWGLKGSHIREVHPSKGLRVGYCQRLNLWGGSNGQMGIVYRGPMHGFWVCQTPSTFFPNSAWQQLTGAMTLFLPGKDNGNRHRFPLLEWIACTILQQLGCVCCRDRDCAHMCAFWSIFWKLMQLPAASTTNC